jgi:uncharacterized protein YxeA
MVTNIIYVLIIIIVVISTYIYAIKYLYHTNNLPTPNKITDDSNNSKKDDETSTDNRDSKERRKYKQYLESNNKEQLLMEWQELGKNTIHPDFPIAPIFFRSPSNRGEEITKSALQHMFPAYNNWRKVRPKWLLNEKTGARLEIDAYCEELEIGVEYNGIQHYVYDEEHKKNPWCKNFLDFEKQVWRDYVKKRTCKKLGITLIVVPYWVPKNHIAIYIFCQFCEALDS